MNQMEKVFEVKNLKKHFPVKKPLFSGKRLFNKAVDGVSFDLFEGETLSIVGESGSGKSTVGRCVVRLIDPTDGNIYYKGSDITKLSHAKLRRMRSEFQMIFQDPFASLNPRMTIGSAISEPIIASGAASGKEAMDRTFSMLEKVGLDPEYYYRYPHQFSGGQRQRVGIARALVLNPKVIIADEAVSALDVSVQAQIINLLKDIQTEFNLTYMFIAHDLSVVKYLSDRIAVMYLGEIMELSDKNSLFENPLQPYTQALISAIPKPNPRAKGNKIILTGDIPSPINPPSGCKFHNRCFKRLDRCDEDVPQVYKVGNRLVKCHLYAGTERADD